MGFPGCSKLFSLCFAKGWGAALLFCSPGCWFLGMRPHKHGRGFSETFVVSDWPAFPPLLEKQQHPESKKDMVWYRINLFLGRMTYYPSTEKETNTSQSRWIAFSSKYFQILENLHCLSRVAWWKFIHFFSFYKCDEFVSIQISHFFHI